VYPIQAVPIVVVFTASLVMAVTDVWKFKVYNVLTLPLLLSGLAYHAVVGGVAGFSGSLAGALFGFAVLLAFYVMGGMGAGDVKLMAAVGAWLGLPWTFYLFIASSLAAGVYSVVLLVMGRNLAETWENFQILWLRVAILGRHLGTGHRVEAEVNRPDRRHRLVPFAAMMMVGLTALLLILAWKGTPR
jgi:prepilin peptidase CpaA